MVDELVFLLHHTTIVQYNNIIAGIVTNHTRRVFLFCATIIDYNNIPTYYNLMQGLRRRGIAEQRIVMKTIQSNACRSEHSSQRLRSTHTRVKGTYR